MACPETDDDQELRLAGGLRLRRTALPELRDHHEDV